MANWFAITVADLKDAKVAALIEALQTQGLGAGQDDPTAEFISDTVNRIRDEIASCANNTLDADATKIPKGLRGLAKRMIVRAMKDRLEMALTEDERKQAEWDEHYLERIAKCAVVIAEPDEAESEPEVQEPGGAVQVVTSSTRKVTRETMDGI